MEKEEWHGKTTKQLGFYRPAPQSSSAARVHYVKGKGKRPRGDRESQTIAGKRTQRLRALTVLKGDLVLVLILTSSQPSVPLQFQGTQCLLLASTGTHTHGMHINSHKHMHISLIHMKAFKKNFQKKVSMLFFLLRVQWIVVSFWVFNDEPLL